MKYHPADVVVDCYLVHSGSDMLASEENIHTRVTDHTPLVTLYTDLRTMCLCFLNSMLADKLNMTPEEAERWIVNLIRNARLDAKIDSKLVRLLHICYP